MRPGRRRGRETSRGDGGFTVLEALVALLLTVLLGGVVLATLDAQRRLTAALAATSEVLASVRVARHAVGTEWRAQGGGVPLPAPGDSLPLRSFRAHALVCPGGRADEGPVVLAEGIRSAEPLRDSVVAWFALLPPQVRRLEARDPASCPFLAQEAWERWRLSAPLPATPVFLRAFRRGSYHLGDGALRYRSGDGTRQPLTPGVLGTPAGRFDPTEGGVALTLRPLQGPPWVVFLRGSGG